MGDCFKGDPPAGCAPTRLRGAEEMDSPDGIRLAVEQLALDDSPEALTAVADALVSNGHRENQELVWEALRSLGMRGVVAPLYELWLATRHPRLTAMLSVEGWIPDFPFHLKVFHALEGNRLSEILHGGAEVVDPLVAATRCTAPDVSDRALHCLEHLSHPDAVDALCARWAFDRAPLLRRIIVAKNYAARNPPEARVLTALVTDRKEAIVAERADGVEPLVAACVDQDPVIAARATKWVTQLRYQAAVDRLAELWVHRRTPQLARIVEQAGYVAATPPLVRVLSALRANRLAQISSDGPESIFPLITAAEDADSVISHRARAVLDRVLENQDVQDALCRVAVEHGSPLALDIARTKGLRPKDVSDAALLYFLTEQWAEYEALDFDMSLLREAYRARRQETEGSHFSLRAASRSTGTGGAGRGRAAQASHGTHDHPGVAGHLGHTGRSPRLGDHVAAGPSRSGGLVRASAHSTARGRLVSGTCRPV